MVTLADKPCLADNAIMKLDAILQAGGYRASVLEVGSGGSTPWIAERATRLISIEHDEVWVSVVRKEISRRGLDSMAEIHHVSVNQLAAEVERVGGKWDVVFIDCRAHQRASAIRNGVRFVVSRGWLVADDYNFPMVRKTVDALPEAQWEVTVLSGRKLHPRKQVMVASHTAFCQRRYSE